MILKTVRTQERAKEMLEEFIKDNKLEHEDGEFELSSANCQCGETPSLLWKNYQMGEDDEILEVAICECCGEEEGFADEILYRH